MAKALKFNFRIECCGFYKVKIGTKAKNFDVKILKLPTKKI